MAPQERLGSFRFLLHSCGTVVSIAPTDVAVKGVRGIAGTVWG